MTREQYVEFHIPKIASICGKNEDLHQIAIIGCLKSFDQGYEDPTKCINDEIEVFLKAQKKLR